MRILFLLCLALVGASVAEAQIPVNPDPFTVAFTSVDHALVTEYEAGFFFAGGVEPVSTQSLGKPPIVNGTVSAELKSRPTALGQYELKIRAKAGADVTAWAGGGANGDQPVPFAIVLRPPANLTIVRSAG